jgi:GABA(A) receptor-associated protein
MSKIKKISLDERKKQSEKILNLYQDKCPIYLSFDSNINLDFKEFKDNKININKYIVTADLTLGQFLTIVRKKINFTSIEAITIFIEEYKNDKLKSTILATNSSTIGELYHKNKDEDGFLYLKVVKDNVFG